MFSGIILSGDVVNVSRDCIFNLLILDATYNNGVITGVVIKAEITVREEIDAAAVECERGDG